MVRILHSFGCWRQRKKVTRGVIDHGSLPACSESSFYQNCVQQYFTTWRCICWWYETLRIRCIWGVPPVFGHKRSSKVAKWRSKQYTYIIYIYIFIYLFGCWSHSSYLSSRTERDARRTWRRLWCRGFGVPLDGRCPIHGGSPKSSILKGLSIINHPAIGVPPFVEIHRCHIILWGRVIHLATLSHNSSWQEIEARMDAESRVQSLQQARWLGGAVWL